MLKKQIFRTSVEFYCPTNTTKIRVGLYNAGTYALTVDIVEWCITLALFLNTAGYKHPANRSFA